MERGQARLADALRILSKMEVAHPLPHQLFHDQSLYACMRKYRYEYKPIDTPVRPHARTPARTRVHAAAHRHTMSKVTRPTYTHAWRHRLSHSAPPAQAWEAEPDSDTRDLLRRAADLERLAADADADAAAAEDGAADTVHSAGAVATGRGSTGAGGGPVAEGGRRRRREAEIRYALDKAAGAASARIH
jgi:hypothetical protein